MRTVEYTRIIEQLGVSLHLPLYEYTHYESETINNEELYHQTNHVSCGEVKVIWRHC